MEILEFHKVDIYNTSNGHITIPTAGLYRVRAKISDSNEGRWGNNHHFDVFLNGSVYQHTQLFFMPVGNLVMYGIVPLT